ncbi:hypothetical protein [Pelosinus fermentans]|uniref:Uncharacterized protein n=1 Tax=Pelosinus fermentans JBW45 TaxID=1192197 RepID=A0A0C5QM29_9FIRM|nr:hypothetical protein [Pelosinus fermentans]AJQ28472.1 hypothetical protein JBW_03131 [Pelosinus fermentans JBW45]
MIKKVFDWFRTIVVGIGFFIVLGSLIIPFLYRVVNPSDIESREQNLRFQFQSITHPEGSKQIEFSINRRKMVKRWINAEYKYDNMSDAEVEKYYYQELIRKGWVKQPVSEEAYKHFHKSIYRKGDYEIVFKSSKDSVAIYLYYRDIFDRLDL